MKLFFIRHAQSANNALLEVDPSSNGRNEDPELTEKGWKQAELLASFLKKGSPRGGTLPEGESLGGFGITHLYTSLMVRAVATGTLVSKATGVPLHALEEIHECGGIYLDDEKTGEPVGMAGKSRQYFQESFPDCILPESMKADGWWDRPFEYDQDRLPRARRFLTGVLEKHGGTKDRVAMISHAGFYNELLAAIFEWPRPDSTWFNLFNTAITCIKFKPGERVVLYMNRADHLPYDLIT
jgi:2,3-bisphosphoglycerate-dependent phosphoglycerate mutase